MVDAGQLRVCLVYTFVCLLATPIWVGPAGGTLCTAPNPYGFTETGTDDAGHWVVVVSNGSLQRYDGSWSRGEATDLAERYPEDWYDADDAKPVAYGVDRGPDGRLWVVLEEEDEGRVVPLDSSASDAAAWDDVEIDGNNREGRFSDIEFALGMWWVLYEGELIIYTADWEDKRELPERIEDTAPDNIVGLAGTSETITIVNQNGKRITYSKATEESYRVETRETFDTPDDVLDIERGANGTWWVLTRNKRVAEYSAAGDQTGSEATVGATGIPNDCTPGPFDIAVTKENLLILAGLLVVGAIGGKFAIEVMLNGLPIRDW